MPTYSREVVVAAPLSDVWAFHSRVSGLEALTPDWMGLTVVAVRGPTGDADPPVLETGAEVDVSIRPAGIGPRQTWTSRIIERNATDERAFFRDEMVDGPFGRWVHTHQFLAEGDRTRVRDVVEYELPGGWFGRAVSPFAVVGLAPMFRYRHRKTKEVLAEE